MTSKSFSLFISISFLVLSVFLISYIFYRSEFFYDGLKFDYYLKYYLIAFLFFCFSIISFFINDQLKFAVTSIIFSSIIGLYIIEIFISLDKKDKSNIEIFENLKKENENIVVRIPPNYYTKIKNNIIFPLSGISNTQTIMCNEYKSTALYKSDRYGFNNSDNIWDEKEIEYLIVGDSYAHSDCMNRKDGIAGNLEKLSNKNVLNLGYGGNGPLIEYAGLREYLHLVNVKKLLWIYTESNDLSESNLGSELKQEILTNYLKDLNFSQKLSTKQNQINSIARIAQNNEYKLYYKTLENKKFHIIKLFNVRNYLKNFKFNDNAIKLEISPEFKKIISLTKKLADQKNIDFYFIYLPDSRRYNKAFSKEKFSYDYEKVLNYLESLEISTIDLHDQLLLNNKNPNLKRPKARHFTNEGYKIVTEFIYKTISDN